MGLTDFKTAAQVHQHYPSKSQARVQPLCQTQPQPLPAPGQQRARMNGQVGNVMVALQPLAPISHNRKSAGLPGSN